MKANKNSKEYASKTATQTWKAINWNLMEEQVRTLQARIVKAQQAGKHRKVRSLQWILTNSFAAKALAVKRVTSNSGKNTPGVDGVTWSTDLSKMKAVQLLQRKRYKPLPLRRVYIPKSNGKMRPLSIPCMKDRAMQALHLMAVDPVGETVADINSYGFRPKRSCADAIEQCFIVLNGKKSAQWVLDADIKGCFDNISHEWMMENIPMDKRMLRLWLKNKIIDGKTFFNSDKGTPQGGIISPWLANMVLNGMEAAIKSQKRQTKNERGLNVSNKVNFIRYADDFIVTADDKASLENIITPIIEKFLQERGLSLSAEKTRIVHIRQGFDFLGQNVRKYKDKLLIKPSRKNTKAVREKIKSVIMNNKTTTQAKLMRQLNPIIRGWATYHRHAVAKQTFVLLDDQIFKILWYWACRRHRNSRRTWIKRKYFPLFRGVEWNFSCKDEDGKQLILYKAQAMPIQRHIKIKGNANPYAKEWHDYFDRRKNPIRL
jgi:RNA-directed DNA polymerase